MRQLFQKALGDGALDHLARDALHRRLLGNFAGEALRALHHQGVGVGDAEFLGRLRAQGAEASGRRAGRRGKAGLSRRQGSVGSFLADLFGRRAGRRDAFAGRRSHPGTHLRRSGHDAAPDHATGAHHRERFGDRIRHQGRILQGVGGLADHAVGLLEFAPLLLARIRP